MKIEVLDHGYVELIEPWGTGRAGTLSQDGDIINRDCEVGIVEAARQSTQGAFRGWGEDAKLLKHLYNNQHSTPFEFAGMVLEVQAPIFVFREWHRHRTQSYTEMSARYTALPDLYYHVSPQLAYDRAVAAQETKNRQAGAGVVLTDDMRERLSDELTDWLAADEELSVVLERHYQRGLAIGVPKELARKKMPVDHYSRMRAGANLRNWLAFMTLRCDPNAQWEIRQYALAVEELIKHTFPRTHSLWATKFWV